MGMFYISVFIFFCIHTSQPALSTRVHHKTTQKRFEIIHLTGKNAIFRKLLIAQIFEIPTANRQKKLAVTEKNKGHTIIFISFYQMQKN